MAVATSYGTNLYAAGEKHLVFRPRLFTAAQKRGVVFCHPHGADASYALATRDIPAALAENGSAVVCTDMGGTTHWGNSTSVARVADSWTFAKTSWGAKTDKVILAAISMGALAALNWAKANTASVAGIVLFAPAVDLAEIHSGNIGGWATEVETAYGGSVSYSAAETASNPASSPAAFSTIPMKIWYSSNDPIALPTTVTNFASAVGATTASMGAIGHAVSTASAAEAASFVASLT